MPAATDVSQNVPASRKCNCSGPEQALQVKHVERVCAQHVVLTWLHVSQVAKRRQVAVPPGVGTASSTPASQQEVQLPDLSLPAALANAEQAYQEALQPLSVADFDASAPQAYNRHGCF